MMTKSFRRSRVAFVKPGKCTFCLTKKLPVYHEAEVLTRFVSDRGKILSRSRSGLCAKHQRRLKIAIKRARHLALLSFINRI